MLLNNYRPRRKLFAVVYVRGTPMDNRKIMDFLLMGLTWLEEDRGRMTPRRAGMVFYTYQYLKVIGEGERLAVGRDTSLISFGMQEMHIERDYRKPPKDRIARIVGTTGKRLVVLAVGQSLVYSRIFGRDGYYLLPSEAGMAYANSVAGQYPVTKAQFLGAWEPARLQLGRQIGAIKGRQGRGRPSVGGGAQQQDPGHPIRPAPLSEDEMEW